MRSNPWANLIRLRHNCAMDRHVSSLASLLAMTVLGVSCTPNMISRLRHSGKGRNPALFKSKRQTSWTPDQVRGDGNVVEARRSFAKLRTDGTGRVPRWVGAAESPSKYERPRGWVRVSAPASGAGWREEVSDHSHDCKRPLPKEIGRHRGSFTHSSSKASFG